MNNAMGNSTLLCNVYSDYQHLLHKGSFVLTPSENTVTFPSTLIHGNRI